VRPVRRSELVDWQTYSDERSESRSLVLAAKNARRIQLGEHFTFLFENRDTVRYQVQEMMRTERIVREAEIQHELDTYNELLHPDRTLGCSLLIGIDDPAERDEKLVRWLGLVEHLYARLEDGSRVRPAFDPRQVGEDRLSAVQYLSFQLGARAPVALGVDLPGEEQEVALSEAQRAALQADLDEP